MYLCREQKLVKCKYLHVYICIHSSTQKKRKRVSVFVGKIMLIGTRSYTLLYLNISPRMRLLCTRAIKAYMCKYTCLFCAKKPCPHCIRMFFSWVYRISHLFSLAFYLRQILCLSSLKRFFIFFWRFPCLLSLCSSVCINVINVICCSPSIFFSYAVKKWLNSLLIKMRQQSTHKGPLDSLIHSIIHK